MNGSPWRQLPHLKYISVNRRPVKYKLPAIPTYDRINHGIYEGCVIVQYPTFALLVQVLSYIPEKDPS